MSEEEIFQQARALRDPEPRAVCLQQAYGADAPLRAAVAALLRADAAASGFMERPAPHPATTHRCADRRATREHLRFLIAVPGFLIAATEPPERYDRGGFRTPGL
jgi:hypothetical protein